jgi:hypothetical protein
VGEVITAKTHHEFKVPLLVANTSYTLIVFAGIFTSFITGVI